ncbi:MAG: hypothetical protein KAS66_03980 [Candidatus Omnitrophica bacterium]|nr:hypothetical protein [Candidatus Omnitrophota bacterium]
MDEYDLKREMSSYELNLPYPFSCFPEPERKKFAFMFMVADRGAKRQEQNRRFLAEVSRNE